MASVTSQDVTPIATYRVINEDGEIVSGQQNIQVWLLLFLTYIIKFFYEFIIS